MKNIFKNEKFWLVAAGAAGVIVGKKIITAKKTRQLAVTGLAKGMKLTSDAKSAFQSMKETQIVLMYTVVTLVLTALAVISVIV